MIEVSIDKENFGHYVSNRMYSSCNQAFLEFKLQLSTVIHICM